MPVSRKRKTYASRSSYPMRKSKYPRRRYNPLQKPNKSVRRYVQRAISGVVETKTGAFTSTDNQEIGHNQLLQFDDTVLDTTQGLQDNEIGQGNRIGDQILLKGISFKFMLELNERFSDVTFKIYVVKSAKGDVPTISTMFKGGSNNKIMDKFNNERYTLVGYKVVKMTTSANTAAMNGTISNNEEINLSGTGIGVHASSGSNALVNALSRRTKVVNLWIPGSKFARYGKIQYNGGGTECKFFDYTVLVLAYSNYTCATGVYCGAVNEYIRTMYYKDA